MQTSFMHPPFGFALFYLRGIADTLFKEKRIPEAIKSNDIYLGAIPWVFMQLLLVTIVIFVPQTVTVFLDKAEVIDLDKVKIEIPIEESATPPAGSAGSIPGTDPLMPVPEPSADDEQKRVEELFKRK